MGKVRIISQELGEALQKITNHCEQQGLDGCKYCSLNIGHQECELCLVQALDPSNYPTLKEMVKVEYTFEY